MRAEQEAWKRLTDEEEPRQELELHDFVEAMEEAMANGETKINEIEAVSNNTAPLSEYTDCARNMPSPFKLRASR